METITINQLIQEIKELKDLLKEKESEKLVYTTKELSLLLIRSMNLEELEL